MMEGCPKRFASLFLLLFCSLDEICNFAANSGETERGIERWSHVCAACAWFRNFNAGMNLM